MTIETKENNVENNVAQLQEPISEGDEELQVNKPEQPPKPTGAKFILPTIKAFLEGIKKVEKMAPETRRDGAIWRLYLEYKGIKKIIEISDLDITTKKMKFQSIFKSNFGVFLPPKLMKKPKKGADPWYQFLEYLESICTEIEQTDTVEWAELNIFLGNVAQLKWVPEEEKELWADNKKSRKLLLRMMNKKTERIYYLLKPEDITTIIKDEKISTSISYLGRHLDKHLLKRKDNPAIRINNKKLVNPAWWFTEASLVVRGFEIETQRKEDCSPQGGY